jgi:hypothetical protein
MSELRWRHDSRRVLLPVLVLSPAAAPELTSLPASALLDTGSTTSGVTRDLAVRLGLPHLGKRPLGSAHGEAQVERFLFRIGLEIEDAPLPFVFDDVIGFELKSGFLFQALIGMDLLSHCDFAIDRQGACRLAFG